MSLEKQTVSIPLVEGISEQDDAWAHDPPGFVQLVEARWNRDKQIGKRHGQADRTSIGASTRGFAPGTAVGPSQIVDLDGVPHILSASGTGRRDAQRGTWSKLSDAAPIAARVTSDPVVRMSGTAMRSDATVLNGVACVVWDTQAIGGTNLTGWYQFFDVTQDTPRPLCPATQNSAGPVGKTNLVACRVVAVSGHFLIAGETDITGARFLYAASYDVSLGTYAFAAGVLVDTISAGASMEFAFDPNADQSAAYIAYHTGATNRTIKKLSTTAVIGGSHALGPGGGSTQIAHLVAKSRLYIIGPSGVVDIIDDGLSIAPTQVTPFAATAAGVFTFLRAAIGIDSTSTSRLVALRSTATPVAFGANVMTQMTRIDDTGALIDSYDMGGVSLATLCSGFDPALSRCYYGLTGGQAWHTQDDDPTIANSIAYRATPVVQICQTVSSALLRPQVVARVGQDAFDMLGNDGALQASPTAVRMPHIACDLFADEPAYVCAYNVRLADQLGGATAALFHRGVDMATLRTSSVTPARNASAQSIRLIGTSHGVSMIDGVLHAENSMPGVEWLDFVGFDTTITVAFGSVPHIDITGSPWGGSPNPNRQWGFVVLWRYTDQHGNVHRGPPSSILWSLLGELIDGSNHPGSIGLYPVAPSALLGELNVVPELEVYACPYDGNGDFRSLGIVQPKADPTCSGRVVITVLNNAITNGAHVVSFSRWDASQPVPISLYTGESGGSELESNVAPALLSLCSTQSRLWGLNAEDRLDVWYTKPIALGFAPEWNDTLRVRVPQDGGPSVAIAAMDDKVIIFKQSRVFIIEGDGGDATGSGSSLRPPRLISSDVGCVSAESVVEGPFGVAFLSQRGFMVLGRDLTYQFVGDRVIDQLGADSDDGIARQVISAALIPYDAEVRFALGDVTVRTQNKRVLAWNYRFNRWTQRILNAPDFLALVGDAEWSMVLGSPNAVFQETPSSWAGSTALLGGQTSWIKFNGIAGFGRLRRAVFVFRYYSGGISIQCSQDYLQTTETLRTWSAAELAALVANERVELVVHPLVQKCEAVSFAFIESQAGGATGRGAELVGVTCELGVKKGAFKRLGAAARK